MIKSILVATAAVTTFSAAAEAREPGDKPNIIFILLDDLGKEWISCYGGEGIKTPNIDALAKSGIRFNNAYSMPQCTPSRACFLTGQYPFKNGWVNHWDSPRWGSGYFDWSKNPSIARSMKNAGYVTGVAGKWQLNDFRKHPDVMVKHGFDEFCMWTGAEGSEDEAHTKKSEQRYWDPYIHTETGSKTYPGKFGPDIYNQFVLDFVSENKEKPFFVYYPMALPHGPLVHTPLSPKVSTKMEKHIAMVEYTDFLLKKLVDTLEKEKIRDNTIIVWTCDNGTSGSITGTMNGREIRGGKTKTTENGVNTPFIVSCPGLIPADKVSDALIDFADMHLTFTDLAGGKPEDGYEYHGVSQKDVFLGKKEKADKPWVLGMGSHGARLTSKGVENVFYFRDRVIRNERFKLFIDTNKKPVKVVDLLNDPSETKNLIGDPKFKEECDKLIAVIATLPDKDSDPDYRPLKREGWERVSQAKPQTHKIGHPNYEKPPHDDVADKHFKKKKKK